MRDVAPWSRFFAAIFRSSLRAIPQMGFESKFHGDFVGKSWKINQKIWNILGLQPTFGCIWMYLGAPENRDTQFMAT